MTVKSFMIQVPGLTGLTVKTLTYRQRESVTKKKKLYTTLAPGVNVIKTLAFISEEEKNCNARTWIQRYLTFFFVADKEAESASVCHCPVFSD